MPSNVKMIKIPFDIDNKSYSYDYSIISYKDGDPNSPRVGSLARKENDYLIKNIKQVMKYSSKERSRQPLWKEENFIFNDKMSLDKFKPDLPYKSFKDLIKGIIINQVGSYLELYSKKDKFEEMDILFGIPVFSNVEGMPNKANNNFKDEYKKNITDILNKLGVKNKIHFLYEPFAIIRHAIHYKLMNFMGEQNDILIIDFGGSTFNCCAVRTNRNGKLGEKTSKYKNVFGTNYKPWGCSEVDKFILEKIVKEKLGKISYKFTNNDYDNAELFKIKISEDLKKKHYGPWKFKLNNLENEISITKENFKELLDDNIWQELKSTIKKSISDANREYLEMNQSAIEKLDFVLFAGGGSNLPFLKEFFMRDLSDYIKSDESIIRIDYPELAVASGLAIDASYRLENEDKENLSDDEYLEDDVYLELFNRDNKIIESVKVRLLENPVWDRTGKVMGKNMRKEDLVFNTNKEYDKKPWEIKLSDKIIYKKIDFKFFKDEEKKNQIARNHIYLKEIPSKRQRELDLFLDTTEDGMVTPLLQLPDGNIDRVGEPFPLWAYKPSKEMIAIDLGNSTTSIFLITDDPVFKEENISDVRELELEQNEIVKNSKKEIGKEEDNIEEEIEAETSSNGKIENDNEQNSKINYDEIQEIIIGSLKEEFDKISHSINNLSNVLNVSLNISLKKTFQVIYEEIENAEATVKFELKEYPYDGISQKFKDYLNSIVKKSYSDDVITNILASINQSDSKIHIIAGFPGVGKTSIVKHLADYVKSIHKINKEYDNFLLVSVAPSWMTTENLIGSYNYLIDRPILTSFTEFLIRAKCHYDKYQANSLPFIVCLDEFNISQPELYLSSLLSELESDNPVLILKDRENELKVPIPPNFKLFATINLDAASKSLSPKILDRANFIRIIPEKKIIHGFIHNQTEGYSDDKSIKVFETLFGQWDNTSKIYGESVFNLCFDTAISGGAFISFRTIKKIFNLHRSLIKFNGNLAENDLIDILLSSNVIPLLPAYYNFENAVYGTNLKKLEDECENYQRTLSIVSNMIKYKRPGQAI
jgi:MoxR-like ATPase